MNIRKLVGKNIRIVYRRGIPPTIKLREGRLLAVGFNQILLRYETKADTVEHWIPKPRCMDKVSVVCNKYDIKKERKK